METEARCLSSQQFHFHFTLPYFAANYIHRDCFSNLHVCAMKSRHFAQKGAGFRVTSLFNLNIGVLG